MKTAIVIPARYGPRRLPGKPLLRQTGKYLIQHVYERACQAARASTVVVATDDPRIVAAVERFGGQVVLTRRDHPSGTDRVAEAARRLDADVVVNLQGDEPLVDPAALDLLPQLLERDPEADMATLAVPATSLEQWHDPNCVKVVCDAAGRALYFSRSPIPHVRDGQPDFAAEPPRFLIHLGLYAYRRPFLFSLAALPPEPLEQLEKLEQLRVLALGRRIHVGVVKGAAAGIDTYDDYERFVQEYRRQQRAHAA
ncbi:MAG: 3-deoxy-manno-octulosonate cytidylyltransferase [Planctomycetes bacterium]|nr:3-deoxy-manno-octulosonate cytidylyltransferase [Planctomycetota bacterium]